MSTHPPVNRWQAEVERRVDDYRARRADRVWRAQHGLGLEPGARKSGASSHPGENSARPAASSELPAASRFLSRFVPRVLATLLQRVRGR